MAFNNNVLRKFEDDRLTEEESSVFLVDDV